MVYKRRRREFSKVTYAKMQKFKVIFSLKNDKSFIMPGVQHSWRGNAADEVRMELWTHQGEIRMPS